MEPSLDCWVDGGEVASRYSDSLHAHISSDGAIRYVQDDLPPFPQHICHAIHSAASTTSESDEHH